MENSVDIVLAIYKPDHYLLEQLDSIMLQTCYRFIERIIIVNDSDEIDESIYESLMTYEKVCYYVNTSRNHGAKNNFAFALTLSEAKYIMTCDQDDVWNKDKIQLSINRLSSLEAEVEFNTPCLIASDVKVVDSELSIIHNSFQKYRGTNRKKHKTYSSLLLRNIFPGCSMAFNRALLKIALPIPEPAIMHDWWLLNVAILKGKVSFIDQATMLYRQHDNNTLGANKSSLLASLKKRSISKNIGLAKTQFDEILFQLHELNKRYGIKPYFDSSFLSNPSKLNLIKFILFNYPYPVTKKLAIIFSILLHNIK
ncbi:hypothetical protein BCV02_01470 [Vibrio breoganii]|uniref:Glycosyltransferase n=1 Tax=Vibrio breoganii TaxID=553239 RepID=A0AAP8MSU3_9VIBR|nr:glycosyltransferase [Vibrio breoganii]NMO74126.1 glycosyltransferase [Vibrio breoganii]NMR70871.1 glycosyltransferase [Vibrio breoganii]PMG02924.1 hypothetical protein BCV02_01470 [Vibrio breoganii]PML88188.1 hypothetical protein BCT67_10775 [Vibrio breoganii]PMP05667.1 hypothetical protein BCS93_18535 [Vibrio breoganii]